MHLAKKGHKHADVTAGASNAAPESRSPRLELNSLAAPMNGKEVKECRRSARVKDDGILKL
ncbi:hypothetical protein EYF80_051284 [Liparis tanakae]|uniref:Uncharacterized protein n=1 Tax=Liparis tanakae TaxID=230148 RepID=A0A4Z2FDT2_9TELE|nr:hypothetical protein EYF80_051284 [Liparis tanakae]